MTEKQEDTLKLYEEKGFGKRSGLGQSPAIVVVDLINGFTDPACDLGSNYDELVRHLQSVLKVAREKNVPIYYTTVIYENEEEGGRFIEKVPALKVLTPDSKWVRVDSRLGRLDHEVVITKKYASAFFGTNLSSMLAANRVDTLIITGATTSGCIRATAIDAMQYGYRAVVPEECVGDRSIGQHEANLLDIDAKYGDVMKTAEVVDYLKKFK